MLTLAVPLDYASARGQFVGTTTALGWRHLAYPIDARGPGGEALTIDVAISPSSSQADHALVVSSGLHGVEGHFGSAVQLAWLERLRQPQTLPSSVGCVLVHALNPYGYAWSRRCDPHNVDLNRGFLWEGMPEPKPDALYARIDPLLNPRRSPSRHSVFPIRVLWAAALRGRPTLQRAIARGQRTFPRGLFYAGNEITSLQRLLEAHLRSWIGSARTVVHLDLHTGLGRPDGHELIVDYPLDAPTRSTMTTLFASSRLRESMRDGSSYTAIGSLGQWCVAQRLAPAYHFAFAEFGTCSPVKVLSALRAENQAHHWGRPADAATARVKALLRERFCPADASWRTRAIGEAVALIERTGQRLA